MFNKIERLKRKARKLYQQALAIGDTMDCGHSMAMVISPGYSHAVAQFNKVWEELRKLDPNCPPAPKWIQA